MLRAAAPSPLASRLGSLTFASKDVEKSARSPLNGLQPSMRGGAVCAALPTETAAPESLC